MGSQRDQGGAVPRWAQQLLGKVAHPQWYSELLLPSQGRAVALSLWQPPRARCAVVFLPGTAVHPLFYADFLDRLSDGGCAVVGVHPQGHGKSPRVRRTLRWSTLIGNAVDATDWARRQLGLPVVLMGSSQGALVALLASTEGAAAVGVIAHNVFDPASPAVVGATKFAAFGRMHRPAQAAVAAAARVAPRLPVPVFAYLDRSRVFHSRRTEAACDADPLTLRTYPLRFLADLMNADTSALFDGSLTVPVVVLTARGDPLFPLDQTRAVVDRLVAPSVGLWVLDADGHLVLNEEPQLSAEAVLGEVDGLLGGGAPLGRPSGSD